MKPDRKREVIELVRRSPVAKERDPIGIGSVGLDFLSLATAVSRGRRSRDWRTGGPQPGTIWNRLRPEEAESILVAARSGAREESARKSLSGSAIMRGSAFRKSSVYRVLKLHGLVREVNVVGFPAGPEYA